MKTELEIPAEVTHLVSQRVTIWTGLEQAMNQAKKVDTIDAQLGSTNAESISPTGTFNTPMEEIDSVLKAAEKDIAGVADAQHEISSTQLRIQQIKGRAKTTIILIVVGVLVVIGVLVVLIIPH